MPRPKGAKNKDCVTLKSNKVYPIRLDIDLQEWVDSLPNKNRYFNEIIRKDMEEQMKLKEQEEVL